jgi:hypothetical protein
MKMLFRRAKQAAVLRIERARRTESAVNAFSSPLSVLFACRRRGFVVAVVVVVVAVVFVCRGLAGWGITCTSPKLSGF